MAGRVVSLESLVGTAPVKYVMSNSSGYASLSINVDRAALSLNSRIGVVGDGYTAMATAQANFNFTKSIVTFNVNYSDGALPPIQSNAL
jgi:hypothetical protein